MVRASFIAKLPLMVHIDAVTTRTGDDGTSALGDGRRFAKDDALFAAMGSIDEVNSVIGCVRAAGLPTEVDVIAARLQQDLFDLGADLCCPAGTPIGGKIHRIGAVELQRLDGFIATYQAQLQPLDSFVLPGGSALASWWHLARTVARRAERDLVTAYRRGEPPVNDGCIKYCNRLSDLCFVLARMANDVGRSDVKWVPAGR